MSVPEMEQVQVMRRMELEVPLRRLARKLAPIYAATDVIAHLNATDDGA